MNMKVINSLALYLSSAWLGVNMRTDTGKTRVKKRYNHMIKFCLDTIINISWGGGPIQSSNYLENLHFDNEMKLILKSGKPTRLWD